MHGTTLGESPGEEHRGELGVGPHLDLGGLLECRTLGGRPLVEGLHLKLGETWVPLIVARENVKNALVKVSKGSSVYHINF